MSDIHFRVVDKKRTFNIFLNHQLVAKNITNVTGHYVLQHMFNIVITKYSCNGKKYNYRYNILCNSDWVSKTNTILNTCRVNEYFKDMKPEYSSLFTRLVQSMRYHIYDIKILGALISKLPFLRGYYLRWAAIKLRFFLPL